MRLLIFATLLVLSLGLDPTVTIVEDSEELDAYVGSTFEIRCDAGNRRSDMLVKWMKKDLVCKNKTTDCTMQLTSDQLPEDQQKYGLKFQPSDTYILIIKNINADDAGTYECQLSVTRIADSADTVYLRVIERPTIDPMKTSSDMIVEEGKDVELSCGAFGIPRPLIKWTRAGNGMMPGGGFFKLGEKLTISQIKPRFRGPYICTASNDVGEIYRTINIGMQFKPVVSSSLTNVRQKLGYSTRLICHVEANPAPVIEWFRNAGPVDDTRIDVTSYDAAFGKVVSKLTIFSVEPRDIGAYSCQSRNSQGESSLLFDLKESDVVIPGPNTSGAQAIIFSSLSFITLVLSRVL